MFFSLSCIANASFLISEYGDIVWKFGYLYNGIVSSDNDNTYVVGTIFVTPPTDDQEYIAEPIMINLYSDTEVPLPFGVGEPLAWTRDSKSIIYGTRTPYKTIKAVQWNCHEETCKDHFDYMLSLWRQGLDEKKPTLLFQHEGYEFGRVTVAPDDSAVAFSLISSSAFNKDTPEVQIVAVPMNGGQPDWIAIGNKPAFGNEPFEAVPAEQSSVPIKRCPGSMAPRLIVGQRAQVASGAPYMLSRPAGGADLRTMNAGDVMLIVGGPTCDANDGFAWWKVNFHGTVGWIAESNSKNYWLEP